MIFFNENKKLSPVRKKSAQSGAAPLAQGRRALSLVPEAVEESDREVKDTLSLRFHQLLVSLEGSERSGCLKITSERQKSRSAILLYKGRVVGSVYGKRSMLRQYLSQDAQKCALGDLAAPGNFVNAYELPEDLVLAAAALFCGQQLLLEDGNSMEQQLEQAGTTLVNSGLPGCIVVTSADDTAMGLIYICRGRMVGLYSASNGWVPCSLDAARKLLKEPEAARVHAAILPMTQKTRLGFSLTGLADRNYTSESTLPFAEPLSSSSFVRGKQLEFSAASSRTARPGNGRNHLAGRGGRGKEQTSTFTVSPR